MAQSGGLAGIKGVDGEVAVPSTGLAAISVKTLGQDTEAKRNAINRGIRSTVTSGARASGFTGLQTDDTTKNVRLGTDADTPAPKVETPAPAPSYSYSPPPTYVAPAPAPEPAPTPAPAPAPAPVQVATAGPSYQAPAPAPAPAPEPAKDPNYYVGGVYGQHQEMAGHSVFVPTTTMAPDISAEQRQLIEQNAAASAWTNYVNSRNGGGQPGPWNNNSMNGGFGSTK